MLGIKLSDSSAKNVNIFVICAGSLFVFSSYFTMANVQAVIVEGAKDPNSTGYVEGFHGDGYLASAILYAVCFVCDFFTPTAIAFIGLKLSIVTGAITFSAFLATFYWLMEELLYTASVWWGAGNALISVALSAAVSRNSSPEDVDRNSGFYFFVYFGSGVVGNVYWYFQFGDSGDDIDDDTRDIFVTVLLAVSIAGTCVYCLLLPMPWVNDEDSEDNEQDIDDKEDFESLNKKTKPMGPVAMLKKSLSLLATKEMALLSVFFLYDGLAVTFWSGVYGPTLSFTNNFDMDGHSLAGLHGILVYAGCMIGGGSLAILGQLGYKLRRYPIVLIATLLNFAAYALIVLYVPKDAPLGETEVDEVAILDPGNTALALTASVLMGVSTGLMETQILALLGAAYPDEASHAFAVQKVVYHGAKCISFGYVGYINLYWQLGILLVLGTLGTVTFVKVDFDARKLELALKRQEGLESSSPASSVM